MVLMCFLSQLVLHQLSPSVQVWPRAEEDDDVEGDEGEDVATLPPPLSTDPWCWLEQRFGPCPVLFP